MTGEKIRDIGFLAWENDLAWMEHMRGKKWHAVLRQEKKYWETLTNQDSIQNHALKFRKLFKEYVEPFSTCGTFDIGGVINAALNAGGSLLWKWKWSSKWKQAASFDCDGTYCWYSRPIHGDHYRYEIVCEAMDGTICWIKKDVSTEFVIRNGHIYYIKLEYPFDTTGIHMNNAYTGRGEKLIFREYDTKRFIDVFKVNKNSIFIRSGTWQESKLWKLEGDELVRVCKDSMFQLPLDAENYILTKKDTYERVIVGSKIQKFILPPKDHEIVFMNIQTGHVITVHDGDHLLWYCQPSQTPKVIFKSLGGEIYALSWPIIHNEVEQKFVVRTVENPLWIMRVVDDHILTDSMCHIAPYPLPRLTATKHSTKSADGTSVSYLLVHKEGVNPKKLLCYVYGAYGVQTLVLWPYMSWAPLFLNDWAVVYSYPRGSGDRGTAWMRAGQAEKHIKTIEDFEAVVRSSQSLLSIPPEKTVIYGRSAGGMMVGGTTARNPDGKLMGATYTEVPFVDGVRSQTNPEIPLVESGFSEYGNPIESVRNFKALLNISPMNSLPSDGAPGVFVICRTGLKDLQVLPFEPVKWVQRLRGHSKPPANKFLPFEEDEAHVYSGEKFFNARSMDLAVLDLWADGKLRIPPSLRLKNLTPEYKMKQQQQGGKRRRTHRRKSHRRKTHRRQQKK